MIKKLTEETFNFENIIKELQKAEKTKKKKRSSPKGGGKELWDYITALRGPDLEPFGKLVTLKSIFTAPLRGFDNHGYFECFRHWGEREETKNIDIFLSKDVLRMFKTRVRARREAILHHLLHVYMAWTAIKKIIHDGEQLRLISDIEYCVGTIFDYIHNTESFYLMDYPTKLGTAFEAVKKYETAVNALYESATSNNLTDRMINLKSSNETLVCTFDEDGGIS